MVNPSFSFFVLISRRRWGTAMNPAPRNQPKSRRTPLTFSSSSFAPSPASTTGMSKEPNPPTKALFKKLCRRYMEQQTPPTDKEMEPLWRMREHVDIEDIIAWRDEVGVRKGVVCEDGKVTFNEWPLPPHEHIVSEFNTQFVTQFSSIFSGTPHYPVFINQGTTGMYSLSRMNLTS
jgi:hypothetical protein